MIFKTDKHAFNAIIDKKFLIEERPLSCHYYVCMLIF